jgi:hypothetical protein
MHPDLNNHVCQYRSDNGGLWGHIRNWWPLPLHLATALTLVLVLVTRVNGRAFLISNSDVESISTASIYQTDVVTLVSIGILLVRLLAALWLALAGWRLAFMILEHQSTSLRELSRVIRFRLPPLSFKGRSLKWAFSMWCIFALSTPSQFIGPMLTGAISWNSEIRMTSADQALVTQPGNNDGYMSHNSYANSRVYEVFGALGLSAIAAPEIFKQANKPIYRRKVPSLQGYPINSTVESVTVPYFNVEGPLQWIMSEEDAGNDMDILKAVTGDSTYPALNFSRAWNPFFLGTDVGRLTIVNTKAWTSAPETNGHYEYPPATIQRDSKLLAVAIRFDNSCSRAPDPPLGVIPQAFMYETNSGNGIDSTETKLSCFMFARFTYSAGAIACNDCRISSDGVVEAAASSSWTVQGDPLAGQALSMMPEVLFYMKIANISSAPMWNNLDNYTIGMLTVAYQASWNSLANYWSAGTTTATTTLKRPVPVLVASISMWRAWTWLGINALLTVSGILLAVLQSQSQAKTVRNPVISALLLDTSRIIQHDTRGLCNAVDIDKADGRLRLRLVVPGNDGSCYRHAYLDVENRQYEQLNQEDSQEQKQGGL